MRSLGNQYNKPGWKISGSFLAPDIKHNSIIKHTVRAQSFTIINPEAPNGAGWSQSGSGQAWTGNPGTVTFSPSLTGNSVYLVNTGPATLQTLRMTAVWGSYVLTGQDVALSANILTHQYLQMVAELGSFTLTGEDATLTKAVYPMSADYGAFTLTGQDVTLTVTVATYTLTSELVAESEGAQTFTSNFVSSGGSDLLSVTGQGATDSGTVVYGTGIVNVTVSKTTNSGLCINLAQVFFKKNGTTLYSPTFTDGQDMSSVTYEFTSLSVGDVLRTEITEGSV